MIVESPQHFIEVQRAAIAKVRYYVDLAKKVCGVSIPYPQVRFGINGTNGGTANAAQNLIQFNPTLLRENVEVFMEQTVGHEVAHLIQRTRWPESDPHGAEWQQVMRQFGLPAKRCHAYDTRNVPSQFGSIRRISKFAPRNDGIRHVDGGKIIEF